MRNPLSPAEISAVVVTRGDVDLAPVEKTLSIFREVVVWDNSKAMKLAVYGRYRAIANCVSDVIYVQDDDCLLPLFSLLGLCDAYQPRKLVANMPDRFRPHYPDSALVGFGAVFDRDLPEIAFRRFLDADYGRDNVPDGDVSTGGWLARYDPSFARTCDVVFSTLTPRELVDVPHEDREFASDASRMWKQASHYGDREAMLLRARAVRDGS